MDRFYFNFMNSTEISEITDDTFILGLKNYGEIFIFYYYEQM